MTLSKKLLESVPQSIRILRKISAEALDPSITFQQLRILGLIQEGQGLTQMAETLQVSLAAVSKINESVVKKGFVVRKCGLDKRICLLQLTPKGKKILDRVGKHVNKAITNALGKLSQEQKDGLQNGLLILDQLIIHMKEV